MNSGEDDSSSVINGRLRPRKSTANTPNPPNKSTHKPENKVAQDRPKRNSIPSKASPNKQDDLTAKADSLPLNQLLCPYCDKKFTTKLAATKHARRIHLSISKQDSFINCLFCNHTEAVSSNIIRHMVDSHPNQYFACLECNTRFLSTSELAEHKLNVCEKQKQAYRSKLRQKAFSVSKKDQKKVNTEDKNHYSGQNKELKLEPEFNGLVISCELKPTHVHDAVDIEDNITTNLILPSKIGNTVLEKNAFMILDDIQWNRRIPQNFSFRNADADQILSRLGVVHRSPRVGESTRREWLKMIDVTSQKFEKCFDTNFYSRVASNVQQNLAKFLDGSFNFSPDPDKVIKTRKTKSSAIINTAEGFPILLPHEQYSRSRFDGYMPRAIAPKHKWKWDSAENEKNIIIDASVMKRDNHVDNCIITLVSSLDIWTQLRMRRKFEGIFCKAATEKIEKQNIIGRELKQILESREIPSSTSQVVEYPHTSSTAAATVAVSGASDFPSFLGLTARGGRSENQVQPAVLSGEWVRPRCYVCCACGDQTGDSRALTAHMAAHHPNAQVQHYEIVGESLLNAGILKHLYVPPSQMSNRTRPLRGFRDCTKCKKSITMEDLHQHMLDCAGDTPTVRRKCRSRPFGVRRRRPRLPDNTIRKTMRKDLRTRHNQKALLRTRPRIRTEVGDAETIRKMIADLPAKRHRQAAGNLITQQALRPKRKLDKQRNKLKIKRLTSKDAKIRKVETKNEINDLSIIDEDDQPLKPKTKIEAEKTIPAKKRVSSRVLASKKKKLSSADKEKPTVNEHQQDAASDEANASQPQQMSSENSTQKLNIKANGNDTIGEEESRNGTNNNDNGDDRKKSPNKERDKDNHKNVAPDPTMLKHSINSITASSNKAPQSHQQNLLPQQANEAEALNDTPNTFLENEVGPSLPEKPPLQSNQKRSSQKKRESLLNCIEKIKSQQKNETMYDQRHAEMMRLNRLDMEYNHLHLMDPHPAVISRTRDESGAAKNVVPGKISGPPVDVAGKIYNTENFMRWRSDTQDQPKPNEMLMLTPIAEPLSVHKKSPEPECASQKAKNTGGQRRKSSSMRLAMAHNEQSAQLQLAHLYYQHQWNLGRLPYASMVQANLQLQIEQSQRRPFPEMVLQQHQLNDVLKNTQYKNQSLLATGQYNVPELHYEGRRDDIPLRIETSQHSMSNKQQNQNLLSLSPQSWSREALQVQQINNNLTVPSMLPSVAANELVIPTNRQTSQKSVSESSETEYYYHSSRNVDDADMLNYANLRRMSSDAITNMYHPQAAQSSRESSHHALTRYRAQIDDAYDKNTDITTLTQDEYGSKTKRSYENRSAFGDSMSKDAEQIRTAQRHTTAVNNKYYTSRLGEDKHQTKPHSGNNIDDSNLENHDDILAKCLYFSNMNKKKLQERYLAENGHLFISSPTENQAAKNYSPNESNIRKSIDMFTRQADKIDDLPSVSSNKVNDHIIHDSYIEVEDHQETSENQTDSGSNDEPLDLSGKHVPAVSNKKTPNVCVEHDQIQYGTLDLSKTTIQPSKEKAFAIHSKLEDCHQMTTAINLIADNASDLYFKDNSASIGAYTKKQHVPFIIDQNSVSEKPTQPSCNRSTVAYYKETNEIESAYHSMDENRYATNIPNTILKQISHDRESKNEKYQESMFLPNVNEIEQSKLEPQTSLVYVTPNENYYLPENVIPLDQLDKKIVNFTPALENQLLQETTEAITVKRMQSNNNSCYAFYNIDATQKVNQNSLINIEPNTSCSGAYPEQSHIQKDLHSVESGVQNKMFESKVEKTCVDNSSLNDDTYTKTPLVDQDPETAKKMAKFPKELVDLLGAVPKDQHNKFVNVISQLIPPNNEGTKPIITVQEPQNGKQLEEAAKLKTPPICDTSTNTQNTNRLTINTALPSSSILPKKRHSPSARLTTQDPYSNLTLSNPSPMQKQQQTTSMNSIPNSTPIENAIEHEKDFSTGIVKNLSEVNECEANSSLGKIIDLTDDDLDNPNMNSHLPTSNVMPIQVPVNIQQNNQKHSSEKTASLRAVRIKTPLARKSLSDDKQQISQQMISLESKQIDLNTAQIPYSECDYNKTAIDNAVTKIPESSSLINNPENKATQSFAPIENEASNYISMTDCDQIEQSEMNAITFNVVAHKDEMRDRLQNSVMQHVPSVNQMEEKKLALSYNVDDNKDAKIMNSVAIAGKYIENDTILETNTSTFNNADGNSQDQFINDPHTSLRSDNDTVVSGTSHLLNPEQSSSCVATSTSILAEKSQRIHIDVEVDDIEQNLKSNENSVAIMSLEPEILQHNEYITSSTNFSEDEDSDDDVSLAVIVKQKQQSQTSSSENNDASTSTMIKKVLPDLEETKKDRKSENKSKISSKPLFTPADTQFLSINSKLNDTVCKKLIVESVIDETHKNDVDKENHEIYGCKHNKDEGTSGSYNKKEDDERVAVEKISVEIFEQTPVSSVENINFDINPQINTNEDAEVDSFQGILSKNCSNGEIESNLNCKMKSKCMLSNREIEATAQSINGPQLKNSEILANMGHETSSTQYFKADEENNSLMNDETNSKLEIDNTQTELQSLSGNAESMSPIKMRANEQETPKTVKSISLADLNMSTEQNETSERDLRRNRRERSMYFNNKDSTDHDTNNTVDIHQTISQKIPVTKKQRIFSKLLLDENTHTKNESHVKSDSTTETKVMPIKRKKSPGKTKNKKKKSSNITYDDQSSVTNTLTCTPENNNKTTDEKEPPCPSEMIFKFNDGESQMDKGKLNISSKQATKGTKVNNKNDNSFKEKYSIIDDHYMNAESIINDTGTTEVLESSQIKLNQNKIDNPVAGTSGFNDLKKQSEKTNTCMEIRTACYNRPIVSKQISSISVKNPENYDPYDIDLDMDMAETSRPTVKRKSNKSIPGSTKSSKKCLSYENHTDQIKHITEIEKPEIAVADTSRPILSDSDSSISDVPLQKYVEEKEKLKIEVLKSSDWNKHEKSSESNSSLIDTSENNMVSDLAPQNGNDNFIVSNNEYVDKSDVDTTTNTAPPTNSRDETDNTDNSRVTTVINDDIENNQDAGQVETASKSSTTKSKRQNHKQKRNRRSKTTKKSKNASKKTKKCEKQVPVDKCLEIFGFYAERQPRKSNLLASKKISETFNMIESDDADFRPRDRPRNSSHSDNRRTTDAEHTSRAATQDATNANSDRISTATVIPHITEPQAGPSSAVDEPFQANDDGEVDLITAQRMLESEEIRKLERDLYSGFKEAAQANAGKTSGFNQLRAEESNPTQNNNHDVSTPTEAQVEIETIQSPERLESPERIESPDRSESPDMPNSPESLKDKPLMYPEEEVNIYEDKYDIIKRRREASAMAKQVQKVDKPKKSKTEKSKKKPERKVCKKTTKKPMYQISQVPTKGALKGFDGIKISIPTQDLNLPPNVSPPNHRQRHSRSTKRKGSSSKARGNSGSSCKSDSDANSKIVKTSDIYEFQDDERPVTKGYKLTRVFDNSRSSSSENEAAPIKLNQMIKEKKNTKQNKDFDQRSDQVIEKPKTKKWKGKGKGKGKYADNEINRKTVTLHEEEILNRKEIQREEFELNIDKVINARERLDGTAEDDDKLSKDYNDTSGKLQENDEPFNDSDIEDPTGMPGTSGFVPDRNDESSYESDSSSPTPLLSVLKGPYACTCLSEIDSDDSETERGCAHTSCRYSHLNAAKNAVMGKIFKNNAVRCDKSDETPDEPPQAKPDLDRLFDSLLEPTTDTSEIATRNTSQTWFFTTHVEFPSQALQPKKAPGENDVSTVDDGFSSPNHRHSEKVNKQNFECCYQTSPSNTNLLKIDDDSTNNFCESSSVPIDNVYVMVSQKQIQTEAPLQLLAAESSDEPIEEKVQEKSEPSNTLPNNNNNTPEDFMDNLDKVPESSDCIRFKYKRGDVKKNRGTQTKRTAPKSDVETSSCEDVLNAAKLTRRNRRANKKHKTHHKRNKACEDDKSDKRRSENKGTAAPKRTRKTGNAVEENETETEEKRREKLSPSRKSDEGISTSHDNSADAYDISPVEETGMAVQRARRKCTVGKQNVLAEHWSSSESEAEPNRAKGRKKNARAARGSRRSREAESGSGEEDSGSRPPAPKSRARAAAARDEVGFDAVREPKDKKEQEVHGWIVGPYHKKLMTMLVCSKSKSRPDDKKNENEKEDKSKKNEQE